MGGRKDDQQKPRMDLLAYPWLAGVARVLGDGAAKYDAYNWARGMNWSRLIGAAYRHLGAFQNGEERDPETGESHLLHLSCCAMFLYCYQACKLGNDDRVKFGEEDY